ncbi:MAG: DsrE family protein [Desulfomonilaceae bacterium]
MAKFLFVLSRGLEDPTRVTRCMQLAAFAKRDGHDVHVFLVDDGVILAKKGIAKTVICPTGDKAQTYLDELLSAETPFYVCTPCAKNRQLDERDFIEGAFLDTAKTLISIAAESKVFTF